MTQPEHPRRATVWNHPATRWVAVLPVALAAAMLTTVTIRIAITFLTEHSETLLSSLLGSYGLGYFLQPAMVPGVFIYVARLTAPKHKTVVGWLFAGVATIAVVWGYSLIDRTNGGHIGFWRWVAGASYTLGVFVGVRAKIGDNNEFVDLDTLQDWAIGSSVVVATVFGAFWIGSAIRSRPLLFTLLWIGSSLLPCGLMSHSVSACFTMTGLRRVQVGLMVTVVVLSFAIFVNGGHVRNDVGERFVEGYRHWPAEPRIDDDGREYDPGDDWSAESRSGRRGLSLLGWGILGAAFAFPALTWKITKSVIKRRSAEIETALYENMIEPET